MKITDLNSTGESALVGDTILSARDLSDKYINRTNEQTLNKIEHPELWELYKVSTGDKFVDKNFFNETSALNRTDFIETENSYMFLRSPNNENLSIHNKNFNLIISKSSGIAVDTRVKKICGDNNNVIIFSDVYGIYYSNNFDIDAGIIGTFTKKVLTGGKVNCKYVNDHFIFFQDYAGRTLYFKIHKTELFKIENITGVFETDSLLDIVLINSVDFLANNNLAISTFSPTSDVFIFLENNDIFIYNSVNKIIYKTNHINTNNLSVYENLFNNITTGSVTAFSYYKNSFIITFKKISSAGGVIFIINDNGVKIKQDSALNNKIYNSEPNFSSLLYIDFINKKIITAGVSGSYVIYYNNFSMNNFTTNVFNTLIQYTNFEKINSSETSSTNHIFLNKNPIFFRILNAITMENGSNQYDYFKADFQEGTFPDNFTMPAIVANTQDEYWTKKEK